MGCNEKRKYQRNWVLNFERKTAVWNKRKDETMTLDIQIIRKNS